MYQYANKWDSAVYYLQLAQPGYEKNFNEKNRQALYEKCQMLFHSSKPRMAILYYEKALALKTQINSLVKAIFIQMH